MQRRQFISRAGMTAIATQRFASAKLAESERSTWQPDGAGSLARVGVLTPDFDPVPESEMWAMAPHGVSIHASRITWKWNHDPREFAEAPQLDSAVEQLVALKPRAIGYAFTSSSYALGAEAEGANLRRPVLTANQVVLWGALRAVDVSSKPRQYGRLFTKSG